MGNADNRIDTHLTKIEIGHLLEAPNDSQIFVRANQHLDECKSCQLLLEEYAAKPAEWKRFVSMMEEQEQHNSRTPQNENEGETSGIEHLHTTAPDRGRNSLDAVAIIILFATLACGVWFSFAELIEYFQNRTWTRPSSAPTAPFAPLAPPEPNTAPPAPMATNTREFRNPH